MENGVCAGTHDDAEPARARPVWRDLRSGDRPVTVGADALMQRPADVVVVGLGASGLAAVEVLAAAGADVIGVDAAGVAAGAAGANGGLLLGGVASFHHDAVARHGRDVAAAWYRRTLAAIERIVDDEPRAHRTGTLRTAADDREALDLRAHAAALRADGIAVEEGSHDGLPALLLPDDGCFDPDDRCRRAAVRAVASGARLVVGHRVDLTEPPPCRALLVAVDGGLEDVVPTLAPSVTSVRLQMLATAPQPDVVLPRPLYHRWGLDYAQQLPTGELLVGGGRDVEGDRAVRAEPHPSDDVQAHIERWARRLGATGAVTHRWAARSAYTPDRLPIDREVAPGVHVVGAYSGHGNVVGPVLARAAARRLLDHLGAGEVGPVVPPGVS